MYDVAFLTFLHQLPNFSIRKSLELLINLLNNIHRRIIADLLPMGYSQAEGIPLTFIFSEYIIIHTNRSTPNYGPSNSAFRCYRSCSTRQKILAHFKIRLRLRQANLIELCRMIHFVSA